MAMSRRKRSLYLFEVTCVAHKIVFVSSCFELMKYLSLVFGTPGVNIDTDLLFGAFRGILNGFSGDYWLLLI